MAKPLLVLAFTEGVAAVPTAREVAPSPAWGLEAVSLTLEEF